MAPPSPAIPSGLSPVCSTAPPHRATGVPVSTDRAPWCAAARARQQCGGVSNVQPGSAFLRRSDLHSRGWNDRAITAAVRAGRLIRPRAGMYLPTDAAGEVVAALRLGGRLACISALHLIDVFVLDAQSLHIHFPATASRLRDEARAARRHWETLHRRPHPRATCVEVFDALVQAVRCQPPRAAVATLDSALHKGVLDVDDVDELFRVLPRRFAVLRGLIDARSESGP